MGIVDLGGLSSLALQRAYGEMSKRNFARAVEWFDAIPDGQRPRDSYSACLVWLSRVHASEGDWPNALAIAERAVHVLASSTARQHLELLRRRASYMGDDHWSLISGRVPRPQHLATSAYAPDLDGVHACGIYVSRGSETPWSRYLRLGKGAYTDDSERMAVFDLAASYLARFVVEETRLLAEVDLAIPVPANPLRYASRMVSFPHTLVEAQTRLLGIPNRQDLVNWNPDAADVEMKRLGRAERQARATELFVAGPAIHRASGARVLVVDDLVTSGATMRSCARLLRSHGAEAVYGLALAHTEG